MSANAVPAGRRVTMLVRNPFSNDTRVEREARSLSRAGYEVTIIAHALTGLPLRESKAGATVKRIPRRGPDLPGLRFLAYRWRLERAIERTRPDILHAHDTDALQSIGPAAARLKVPFVYDAHELWLGRSRRGRSAVYDWLARRYYRWVEARYLPRAAAVIVANPPVAPHLQRAYGLGEAAIVPNYPEETVKVEPRDLRSLPGGASIPEGVPIVLYTGGITQDRGIEQLVEAMTLLPQAHLAFLGGGGLEPAIRALVAERGLGQRTHFLGMVPSDEVVPYSASATVGVLSTVPVCLNNVYALPNKIFQYMAAGIPVVASDYPQIREVVAGSDAGVVVDPTDPRAIAAALRIFLDDPARAAKIGANGRRAVLERYRWSSAEETLLDVYRGLAG